MNMVLRSLTAMVVLLLVGTCVLAQGTAGPSRGRGSLPPNWSKLGLSEDQRDKVYSIRSTYRGKIEELQKQLSELRTKERTELEAILTEAQKARLREILTEKGPKEIKKPETGPAPVPPKEVKKSQPVPPALAPK